MIELQYNLKFNIENYFLMALTKYNCYDNKIIIMIK